MRLSLWLAAGLVLGLILHLLIVLTLPRFAVQTVWSNIAEMDAVGKVVVLEAPAAGTPNPLDLDPEIAYALCRFDLSQGPGVFSGELPVDFWSVGIFDQDGITIYSTTNRSGVGQSLELGIFNPAQTRLLAEQQFEIQQGLLIVEAPGDDVFAVVRLAVPYPEMHARYREALSRLKCGHIDDPSITSGT